MLKYCFVARLGRGYWNGIEIVIVLREIPEYILGVDTVPKINHFMYDTIGKKWELRFEPFTPLSRAYSTLEELIEKECANHPELQALV